MLESADPKHRVNALLLLRETGAAAVPVFIWALQDEDPSVRIAAVKSFVALGAASESAAVPLANLLETEPIPAVQKQIIFTLGQMGPYATEAVPVLRHLQREASLVVRVNASQALDRILNSPPRH
ncbi:MAG: HEAT repeat domain-containing protein [Candidatus Methylomirabilota bacterium]